MQKNFSNLWSVVQASILIVCTTTVLFAQNGENDSTFNVPDAGVDALFKGTNKAITNSVIQQDNQRIIITGPFTEYNSATANYIACLKADGNLDPAFVAGTGFDQVPDALVMQSDNRIILAGSFSTYNGNTIAPLVRLQSDGAIDNTFNIGSGPNNTIYAITLQNDGKLLVNGSFNEFNGSDVKPLVRLNSNGSLDFNFHPFDTTYTNLVKVAQQSDGKIVLCFSGNKYIYFLRMNENGTRDNTFFGKISYEAELNWVSIQTTSLLIQQDGKILVAGGVKVGQQVVPSGFIYRLNADGQTDTSFQFTPSISQCTVNSLQLQSDGKIIYAGVGDELQNGLTVRANAQIARLNSDGTVDPSFLQFNKRTDRFSQVYATSLQSNGKIIVAGLFPEINGYSANNIARLNSDGSMDATFNKKTGANGDIKVSAVQSNGKILIGGNFSAYQFQSRNHIARLDANGNLDTSFDPGTGTNGPVYAIALQGDGKILIGGDFSKYNNQPVPGIVRLTTNGNIDVSFNPVAIEGYVDGKLISASIHAIALQQNSKIIVAGNFDRVNGIKRVAVARLNKDGSFDNTLNCSIDSANRTIYNDRGTAYAVALHPSGKIFVGGNFRAVQGTTQRTNMICVQNDGTLDSAFSNLSYSTVRAFAIQTDGKILATGGADSYGNFLTTSIIRYHTDGTRDTSFHNLSSNPDDKSILYSLTLLNSGKILAGGWTNMVDKISHSATNLFLVNSNGELDTAFIGNTDGIAYTTSLVDNERVIIGGSFNDYTGTIRNNLARILTGKDIPTVLSKEFSPSSISVYPVPASSVVRINQLKPGNTLIIQNAIGEVIYSKTISNSNEIVDVSAFSDGLYFATQVGNTHRTVQKFMVLNQ